MPRSPEASALDEVQSALEALLGPGAELRPQHEPAPGRNVDMLLRVRDVTFAVECKAVGDAANVGSAVRQLAGLRAARGGRSKALVPLVAVPFMGETGRRLCAEAGVSWLDLSGNAWIDAPGRQIHILGHRNRFASAGRPANVFAPKSSRVVRVLLMEPTRAFTQAELASASGVDKGRLSRVVRRLETMGLVERVERTVRVKDPALALEAWREAYDFSRHRVMRGILGARDSDEAIQKLAETLDRRSLDYAMTGLAGAWLLTKHAMFRVVTVLVREPPPASLLAELGLIDESRGANVWIVVPNDDAVFWGSRTQDGVFCAHPMQVYLDLKAHPERAPEAAAELRRSYPTWE